MPSKGAPWDYEIIEKEPPISAIGDSNVEHQELDQEGTSGTTNDQEEKQNDGLEESTTDSGRLRFCEGWKCGDTTRRRNADFNGK